MENMRHFVTEQSCEKMNTIDTDLFENEYETYFHRKSPIGKVSKTHREVVYIRIVRRIISILKYFWPFLTSQLFTFADYYFWSVAYAINIYFDKSQNLSFPLSPFIINNT